MTYSPQTWNDGEAGGTPVSAARLTHMETGISNALASEDNLSDLDDDATARTNLGLGDSAVKNTGTTAGTVAAGDHVHAGSAITSGTVATARLDTGTGGTQVALGNHNHSGTYANASHTHAGSDVNSGTVPIAQIPTGTSGTTVSLGNHSHAGSWVAGTLGTNISAGTAIAPGSRLEGDRVFLRGTLSWTSATISANATIMTVTVAHRPATTKRFSTRSSPSSNVSTSMELESDGTLSCVSSLGTTTSGEIGLDGFSYDLS